MIRLPASAQNRETWFAMARICFATQNLKLHATWPRAFFWPLIYISHCTIHAWCGVALPSPHIYLKASKPRRMLWCSFFQPRIYISKGFTTIPCGGPLLYPLYIYEIWTFISLKNEEELPMLRAPGVFAQLPGPSKNPLYIHPGNYLSKCSFS